MELIEFANKYRFGRDKTNNNKFGRLKMFDFEKDVFNMLQNDKKVIIKKSRQMHMTNMLATYIAWLMYTNLDNYFEILYFAPKKAFSNDFISLVRLILNQLNVDYEYTKSDNIKIKNGPMLVGNKKISIGGNNDNIKYLIIDEVAYMGDKLGNILNNLKTNCENIIIASTPSKYGEYFKKIFIDSVNGKNDYKNFTLHYSMDPTKDGNWLMNIMSMYKDLSTFEMEVNANFFEHYGPINSNKNRIIQFRISEESYNKICTKLLEEDINISKYIRRLIENDLNR